MKSRHFISILILNPTILLFIIKGNQTTYKVWTRQRARGCSSTPIVYSKPPTADWTSSTRLR